MQVLELHQSGDVQVNMEGNAKYKQVEEGVQSRSFL